MLYGEIIAVCAEIHTEQLNTVCGQNVEFLSPIGKLRKAVIIFVISVSACLSVWSNWAPTRQVSMEFHITFFSPKLPINMFSLKSDPNNGHFT